jgi:radical SAM-linked protein
MRLRITFAKTEAMRFTGHLDLYRTWERTLRRARLPLAYSQGFNPHPHINLASALPLGFTSQEEMVDIRLEQPMQPEDVAAALRVAAPPGIVICRVEEVPLSAPTTQVILESSEFVMTFLEPVEDLETRVQTLLAAASLPRTRRDKPYDLRPLILALSLLPLDPNGHPRALIQMTARDGATGRPEEVAAELGVKPEDIRVHRTRLIFRELASSQTIQAQSVSENHSQDATS